MLDMLVDLSIAENLFSYKTSTKSMTFSFTTNRKFQLCDFNDRFLGQKSIQSPIIRKKYDILTPMSN